MRLLLDRGVAVDPLDESRRTPLILAANRQNLGATYLLVSSGASLSHVDDYGLNAHQTAEMQLAGYLTPSGEVRHNFQWNVSVVRDILRLTAPSA